MLYRHSIRLLILVTAWISIVSHTDAFNRAVVLDTEGDIQAELWKFTGTYNYSSKGGHEDPRLNQLLSGSEGLWIVNPILENVDTKTKWINTVTVSYNTSGKSTLNSLNSLSVKFTALGDSYISVFTSDLKRKTNTKDLVPALGPFSDWSTFEATLNGNTYVELQFTAVREFDLIVIDQIRIDGNSSTIEPPTESPLEPGKSTPDPDDDEYGLLLVKFVKSAVSGASVSGLFNGNSFMVIFMVYVRLACVVG